jgi:hypothetical protein
MAAFIEKEMSGIFLKESDFISGSWVARIQDLLNLNRVKPRGATGAEQIGRFIRDRVLQNR